MTAETHALPKHLSERGPLWAVGFVVLWVSWAVLFVHEYVGDSVRFSSFVIALIVGMSIGIGLAYWLRRTESGLRVDRSYRNAPLDQQIILAVVTVVPVVAAGFYFTESTGISSLLLEVGVFGGTLTNHLFDVGLVYSHTE